MIPLRIVISASEKDAFYCQDHYRQDSHYHTKVVVEVHGDKWGPHIMDAEFCGGGILKWIGRVLSYECVRERPERVDWLSSTVEWGTGADLLGGKPGQAALIPDFERIKAIYREEALGRVYHDAPITTDAYQAIVDELVANDQAMLDNYAEQIRMLSESRLPEVVQERMALLKRLSAYGRGEIDETEWRRLQAEIEAKGKEIGEVSGPGLYWETHKLDQRFEGMRQHTYYRMRDLGQYQGDQRGRKPLIQAGARVIVTGEKNAYGKGGDDRIAWGTLGTVIAIGAQDADTGEYHYTVLFDNGVEIEYSEARFFSGDDHLLSLMAETADPETCPGVRYRNKQASERLAAAERRRLDAARLEREAEETRRKADAIKEAADAARRHAEELAAV